MTKKVLSIRHLRKALTVIRHFMKPTIYHNDFGTLRKAYLEIKAFVEKKVGAEVESLDTKIEEDLGCTGDDSYELIEDLLLNITSTRADSSFQSNYN